MAILSQRAGTSLADMLCELCRQLLPEIILDPTIVIRDISVDVMESPRFDSAVARTCYVITISTNDASMLRGAVQPYKGSYKERLEAILDHALKQAEPSSSVFVQIAGPNIATVDRLIPIGSFLKSKKLLASSPIVRTAKRNGIGYIQIRGRHLIAPSPAIAEFLEKYGAENVSSIRRVADLFAGTGIATKVLLRVARPEHVVLIDNDHQKIRGIARHISDDRVKVIEADALRFQFVESYDLAVADPYYEDVDAFLESQLDNVRRYVGVLILVPGNIEDRLWNDRILARLEKANYDINVHALYGQVIFEAKAR